MTFFQVIWFFLVGVLLTGFAVLDGFDFGVGMWYLRAKTDDERRTLLNAVGPVWDGNEVWLLTGGGAIFAAFPPVYATVFSGFYLAMMLLVLCLVLRAVSLEFRSKETSPVWRSSFDVVFSFSSIVASLLFGVALGNVMRGISLNEHGDYTGGFLDLLNPYSILVGVTGLSMMAFHGANFIHLKAVGNLYRQAIRWSFVSGVSYLFLLAVSTAVTWLFFPHLVENYRDYPALFLVPLLTIVSVVFSLIFSKKGDSFKSLIASSVSIVGMMGIVGGSLFPRIVPASNNLSLSLTIGNSSSSDFTLKTMFILALVGMPLVLGYTFWVYRAFGGKVDIESPSNHY